MVVRLRGSHIVYTLSSEMVVRSLASHADSILPRRKFRVLISVRGSFNLRAILRLEEFGELGKKFDDTLGIRNRSLPTSSSSTNCDVTCPHPFDRARSRTSTQKVL
jgi:hypothetical protein